MPRKRREGDEQRVIAQPLVPSPHVLLGQKYDAFVHPTLVVLAGTDHGYTRCSLPPAAA